MMSLENGKITAHRTTMGNVQALGANQIAAFSRKAHG